MRHIETNSTDIKEVRKNLKKDGWVSGHYLSRRFINTDHLRKRAKAGEIKALKVHNGGTTTWYYRKSDFYL